MAPVEISVAGSSTIYRPPERVILRVEAKSEGLYQDEVTSQVDGLNWELTNDTRKSLRSECRKSALQDAIHIAGEYAEVIGREVLRDVHVVQVKDSSHMVDYDACRFSASWGEEHHRLDPTPQDIPSRHHVDVTFRRE